MNDSNSGRGIVAITGANGTIGYACTVYALNLGYRVRCVVRREDAIATIKSAPSVQNHLNNLSFAVVPDNAAEGAYDDAFVNVNYVVHIAGAWPLPHYHPDNDIYYPFMKSMDNVLKAAEKAGTVKRVVFTQAGAGLVNSEDGDTLGTQMDLILNEHTPVNQASETFTPPLASVHNAYCSSKAQCMSHLNSLRLAKSTPFSIAQVIPGTVIGPSEFAKTPGEALKHMDRQTKALLFDEMKPRYAFGFVNVRDCARVHINALDETKVRDEDLPSWFIAAGTTAEGVDGRRLWDDAAFMVEECFAEQVQSREFKIGREKMPINMPFRVDSSLTEKMLLDGEKIMGLEDSVREVAEWYLDLKKKTGD